MLRLNPDPRSTNLKVLMNKRKPLLLKVPAPFTRKPIKPVQRHTDKRPAVARKFDLRSLDVV